MQQLMMPEWTILLSHKDTSTGLQGYTIMHDLNVVLSIMALGQDRFTSGLV